MAATSIRVFISYAHENDAHRISILALAEWLRDKNIVVITDHPYENRPPEKGWQAWMLHEIEAADVVLLVCSENYIRRFEKREQPGRGAGVVYEGAIITQELYEANLSNDKFFPILPDSGDQSHIPKILRAFNNSIKFPSQNERIFKLITEVPLDPNQRVGAFSVQPPGQLTGPDDFRLLPAQGKVYGRDEEVENVYNFLRSEESGAVVAAVVTGTGGIGKTEVCKAALRRWLTETPDERAFYISLTDRAGPEECIFSIGVALGYDNIARFEELAPLLRPGLYYIDNLESLADTQEGLALLRLLRSQPGLRILASSRVPANVLGKHIGIGKLPPDAAFKLFSDTWNETEQLEDTPALRQFLEKELGFHALSIVLTAHLGMAYPLADLMRLWKSKGVALARSEHDQSRLGSVYISMHLTSDWLQSHPPTLLLWTIAAVFPEGLDSGFVQHLEKQEFCSSDDLMRLVRHSILQRKGDTYEMLPPLARFALNEALQETGGFSWNAVQDALYPYFLHLAESADETASTDEALKARRVLLLVFPALHRFLLEECRSRHCRNENLARLNEHLRNHYQFQAALSEELLAAMLPLFRREVDLWRAYGTTLQALGDLESRLGNPDQARKLYEQAIELYQKEQDGLGLANVWQSLGDLEREAGRHSEALPIYIQAVDIYYREQDRMGLAYTTSEMVRCYHALNMTKEMEQWAQVARDAAMGENLESLTHYVIGVLKETGLVNPEDVQGDST